MQLWLVDSNPALVAAWESEFADLPNIFIREANILDIARNAIVSPANSYGFMDGGIDRLYSEFFGLQPQTEIQKSIQGRPEGYLPVGTAVLVNTGNAKIPFMIAAPTMMSPDQVRPQNSFFAMSAILQVAYAHKNIIKELFCPGLATGIGRVSERDAAREMAAAYIKLTKKYE